MQFDEITKNALDFNKKMREYFGKIFEDFQIFDTNDDVDNRRFSIDFAAYDYFIILVTYENGRIKFGIEYGEHFVEIQNSQKWWDKADFNVMFKELKEELELRIPDKYLQSEVWLEQYN